MSPVALLSYCYKKEVKRIVFLQEKLYTTGLELLRMNDLSQLKHRIEKVEIVDRIEKGQNMSPKQCSSLPSPNVRGYLLYSFAEDEYSRICILKGILPLLASLRDLHENIYKMRKNEELSKDTFEWNLLFI
jgi:hypothetical protein